MPGLTNNQALTIPCWSTGLTNNYCDNYAASLDEGELLQSTTFEAAILDKDGELIVWPEGSGESYDTVGGYIPIADLSKWISYVSDMKAPSK